MKANINMQQGHHTGIVDIWDLPDDIRMTLESNSCSEILERGRRFCH